MTCAKKDVLTALKAELAFIERGGYRNPAQAAWRPQFIFEDSPTCLNYRNFGNRVPCNECPLMDFVPDASKKQRFPCRYIPLDEAGQTLDHLYRTATEEEAHAIVANWLKNTIARLERDHISSLNQEESSDEPTLCASNKG